jgi:hypothetical protein
MKNSKLEIRNFPLFLKGKWAGYVASLRSNNLAPEALLIRSLDAAQRGLREPGFTSFEFRVSNFEFSS